MATQAQLAANQANAEKSTGPRSEAGKAMSSQNRRTHGLTYHGGTFSVLPCESQADFVHLVADLAGEHQPQTPTESLLVERMAQHQWLRDRALRLQESCFDPDSGQIADQKTFSLYLRYATTHERAFHKCLADLLKLRAEKRKEEIGFESEKRKQELHPLHVMFKTMEITMRQIRESEFRSKQTLAQLRAEEQNQLAGSSQAA